MGLTDFYFKKFKQLERLKKAIATTKESLFKRKSTTFKRLLKNLNSTVLHSSYRYADGNVKFEKILELIKDTNIDVSRLFTTDLLIDSKLYHENYLKYKTTQFIYKSPGFKNTLFVKSTFEEVLWASGIVDDLFSGLSPDEIKAISEEINVDHVSDYCTKPRLGKIKYIAIHYVAGRTSKKGSAVNVAAFFATEREAKSSADFIVDDVEIVQYNPDVEKRYCYAVGDKVSRNNPKHEKGGAMKSKVTNANTVSIEMCNCTKGNVACNTPNADYIYFTDGVIKNTIKLTKLLMSLYNIPKENVIRHYDATGKPCPGVKGWNPEPGSNSESEWEKFKNSL